MTCDGNANCAKRMRPLLDLKYFATFLLILSILPASVIPLNAQFISFGKTFNGPDRTIIWTRWQQNAQSEFRFRTGDRYLAALSGNTTCALSSSQPIPKRSNCP